MLIGHPQQLSASLRIDAFASGLGSQTSNLPAAVWLIGWLSVALCNLVNNQPLTILMTRILLNPKYSGQVSAKEHQVSTSRGALAG